MNPKQILNRLTGISTPVFGVSWEPPVLDVDTARRVIVFLEDRRVLYAPYAVEHAHECIESVVEIRRFLTEVISAGGLSKRFEEHLRAMRAAGRKFLTDMRVEHDHDLWVPQPRYGRGHDDWVLNQALGEMRARFGMHIAQIAVMHDSSVEDPLASVLPPGEEDE